MSRLLRERGAPLSGFTTEEMRSGGRRIGFAVEALSGERAVLAHVDASGPPRVGKYGVDVAAFELVALPALDAGAGILIVDEIGKMELASTRFRSAVSRLFETRRPLVATVPLHAHPFTDSLKSRPDVEVVRVTTANREALPLQLADRLASSKSSGR